MDGRLKQTTLLNQGRHFELPAQQWPLFCARLGEVLAPQASLARTLVPQVVEQSVQQYAERLQPLAVAGVGRVA